MIRAFSFLQRDPHSGLLSFRLRVPDTFRPLSVELKSSALCVPLTSGLQSRLPIGYVELTDYFKRLKPSSEVEKGTTSPISQAYAQSGIYEIRGQVDLNDPDSIIGSKYYRRSKDGWANHRKVELSPRTAYGLSTERSCIADHSTSIERTLWGTKHPPAFH